MKKVTTSESLITISHYRNLLVSEGIPAVIRNEYLGSIIGEMPFQHAWPELWVKNDLDYDRALATHRLVAHRRKSFGTVEVPALRLGQRRPVRRLLELRQKRLNQSSGTVTELAKTVARRHAAAPPACNALLRSLSLGITVTVTTIN